MKKFENTYLFSDLDGTLITADFKIPENNISAIKHFIDNGGHFAFATGRGHNPYMEKLAQQLSVNFPCILLNGGLMYDFEKKNTIELIELPQEHSRELAKKLLDEFPKHSISVWCPDCRLELSPDAEQLIPCERVAIENVKKPICKLVINNWEDEQPRMIDFINRNIISDEITVTVSSAHFIEVMPAGITKGSALEQMINMFSLDRSRVIAMGDYFNDYEMLSVSGIHSFCPQNAHDVIKALCEATVRHVDNGAVANVISMLENGYKM